MPPPHMDLSHAARSRAQARPVVRSRRRTRAFAGRLMLAALMIACLLAYALGCGTSEKLVQPSVLVAPYATPQLWAVVPPVNESGVSTVKTDQVADAFVHELEEVQGVDVLPVNRVLLAMRTMGVNRIDSPATARSLMRVLGVDGLIVGVITAYDPYRPPTFGAAIQLFRAEEEPTWSSSDTVALSRSASDRPSPADAPARPTAQASAVLDAANHTTLAEVRRYATGRVEPTSAYGADIYLVDMELYMRFAAHRLIGDLLADERTRLTPPDVPTDAVAISNDQMVESAP